MAKLKPAGQNRAEVDAYMADLHYPLKAEVESARAAILAQNPEITQEIKWNAPSFGYRGEYLVTFNLADKKKLRLVFHNPLTPRIKSEILEGDYADGRRLANIGSASELEAKKPELERVIRELIALVSG